MFDFFGENQNPFMMMMNMCGAQDSDGQENPDEEMKMHPMLLMQQAFMMQMQMMQMMQMMLMMPIQMMSAMLPMMQSMNPMMSAMFPMMQGMNPMLNAQKVSEKFTELKEKIGSMMGGAEGDEAGFKLGNISIPPAMIGKLMQMDMSPENLEKLQSILDFVFEVMPKRRDDAEAEEE